MGKRSSQRKNAAMMDFGICVSSTSTTRSFRNEDMQVEKDSLLDQAVDALNEKRVPQEKKLCQQLLTHLIATCNISLWKRNLPLYCISV